MQPVQGIFLIFFGYSNLVANITKKTSQMFKQGSRFLDDDLHKCINYWTWSNVLLVLEFGQLFQVTCAREKDYGILWNLKNTLQYRISKKNKKPQLAQHTKINRTGVDKKKKAPSHHPD